MITRAHKIKLAPNKAQAVMLSKTAGTARYAYNWGLAKWNELYEAGIRCSWMELSREWTASRPEWSKETHRGCQTTALRRLGGAFTAFFQGRAKHPVFHKRGRKDSFYVDNAKGRIYGNKLHLPNIGRVRMHECLRYEDAKVMSYNVSRLADGWYVTISVEIDEERRTNSESFVGIDVGCNQLAVASDGTVCKSPAQLKDLERQLKRRQRILARKQRGSNNHRKAANRVSRTYQRINNVKHDVVHKYTAYVAKNHGTVCLETLNVKGMQQSGLKSIRVGVHNSCMAEIHRQLKYKCNNFIEVDRFFPSSKTCSNCGSIKEDLTLSDRTYHCGSCHTTIDRDLNAALNLLKEGLRIYTLGHRG